MSLYREERSSLRRRRQIIFRYVVVQIRAIYICGDVLRELKEVRYGMLSCLLLSDTDLFAAKLCVCVPPLPCGLSMPPWLDILICMLRSFILPSCPGDCRDGELGSGDDVVTALFRSLGRLLWDPGASHISFTSWLNCCHFRHFDTFCLKQI